jgi:protein gp37
MNKTKIDWTDYVWNPVVGCTGLCPYCYARKMAHRFHRDFAPHWVENNFQKAMPKKASRIFVNSMSDVADWEPIWLSRVDQKIREYPEHTFLMLTKRSEKFGWYMGPSNVLLGASCTDQESYMAESFQVADGLIQFLSIEPLLGKIDMAEMTCGQTLRWIIAGAETGNRKGRIVPEPEWIEDIYEYATDNDIPLFFKESLKAYWPFDGYDYFPKEYPSVVEGVNL